VFTEDSIPAITNFGYEIRALAGSDSRTLTAINPRTLSGSQMGLYMQPWDYSLGNDASFIAADVSELLLEKIRFEPSGGPGEPSRLVGRVLVVRNAQRGIPIAEDRFVLSATGAARNFVVSRSPGDEVTVEWKLTGGPSNIDWN